MPAAIGENGARSAGRDIAPGDEVRISYGPLSDGELALTYGFVEALPAPALNPHNKVLIPEGDVREAGEVRRSTALVWPADDKRVGAIVQVARPSSDAHPCCDGVCRSVLSGSVRGNQRAAGPSFMGRLGCKELTTVYIQSAFVMISNQLVLKADTQWHL